MAPNHFEQLTQAMDEVKTVDLETDIARLRAKLDRLPTRRDIYLMHAPTFVPIIAVLIVGLLLLA